ncbi:MAG: DUF2911 domain-containing protein [Chitinophagaceae bacterium]|nr:DUF2911 domain-containing protein [Chitinophagaceae bacterium]
MKKVLLSIFLLSGICALAQQKPTDLDKSPMDMSYWPANYPILKMSGKASDQPIARIIYSRPLKNGRTIFGGIIKYNEMWRLGANEATEVEFFKAVKIAGKSLPKGRYTIYCLPTENKWTIIFNKDNYCWGNFSYDSKKDIVRADIDVEKNADNIEAFTIYFEDAKTGANMIALWDDVKTSLPIVLDEKTGSKKK